MRVCVFAPQRLTRSHLPTQDTDGGGWTLIAKARSNEPFDTILNNANHNLAALKTPTFDTTAGTMGNDLRMKIGGFYRFTCSGVTRWACVKTPLPADSYWDAACGASICWLGGFSTNCAEYNEPSAPDCSAPDCNGPNYAGRNWARRGAQGCGLFGNYNSDGLWWAK